jgi:hypothetical protein
MQNMPLRYLLFFILISLTHACFVIFFQEGIGFNTTVLNGTKINVAFILAQEDKIIKAGNITFNVAKDTTKWSLEYQNWPFQNATNQLRLVLRFVSLFCSLKEIPHIVAVTSLTSSDGSFTTISKQQMSADVEEFQLFTTNTELTIKLLNSALINGVQKKMSYAFVTSTSPWQLNLTFPAFKVLEYDPNFGILINTNSDGSSCGESGYGDGGSDTLLV